MKVCLFQGSLAAAQARSYLSIGGSICGVHGTALQRLSISVAFVSWSLAGLCFVVLEVCKKIQCNKHCYCGHIGGLCFVASCVPIVLPLCGGTSWPWELSNVNGHLALPSQAFAMVDDVFRHRIYSVVQQSWLYTQSILLFAGNFGGCT